MSRGARRASVQWVAIVAFAVLGLYAVANGESRPPDPVLAARYDEALAAYDAHRFDDAQRGFKELAAEGVPQAEFMLGVMHEFGEGTTASYSDAARWYETAANHGLTSAETRLGVLYIHGTGVSPDLARARMWLERAAAKRDPVALLTLGDLYARGQGVPQSLEDAYAYYLLSKAAGGAEADRPLADLESGLSPGRRAHGERRADEIRTALAGAGEQNPREEAATSPAKVPTVARVRFVPATVRDNGLGGDALHLLLPEGWTLRGDIKWRADSASPADLDLHAENAAANLAIRLLPKHGYVWRSKGSADPSRPFIAPRGYESQPPVGDASVFVERVVLPEHHRAGSYEVLERRPLPAIARVVAASAGEHARTDVSAARVRVRVRSEGATFDEDVYCVLVQTRSSETGEELIYWGPERLYGFRAPEGRLDEQLGLLQSITSSMRFDDAWLGRYDTLRADLRDRPGRSRISDREFELFLQSARGSHANARSAAAAEQERLRVRVNEALTAEFGQTETFFDSRNEREVCLPRGYARAWAGSHGDYLVSRDSADDPTVSAPGGEWTELHAVSAR